MIYIDATEDRENTPKTIKTAYTLNQAVSIVNLEEMTGTDIVVSPNNYTLPSTLKPDLLPHRKLLEKVCDKAFLVQRKSGVDAVSSIPDYAGILYRMRQWSSQCWLLTTGHYEMDNLGNVEVNGQKTGFLWVAFQGALRAWQLDGGYYVHLNSDNDLAAYLAALQVYVNGFAEGKPDKTIEPRQQVRNIIGPDDEDRQIATLMSLPGIGIKMAWECWEAWGKDLATCLMFLSDVELYEQDKELYPRGIGKKTIENCARYIGGKVVKGYDD